MPEIEPRGKPFRAPNNKELKHSYQQRQNKDDAESKRAFQFQDFGV